MIKELLSRCDLPRLVGVGTLVTLIILGAICIWPCIPPDMRLISIPIIVFITLVAIVVLLMTNDDINW